MPAYIIVILPLPFPVTVWHNFSIKTITRKIIRSSLDQFLSFLKSYAYQLHPSKTKNHNNESIKCWVKNSSISLLFTEKSYYEGTNNLRIYLKSIVWDIIRKKYHSKDELDIPSVRIHYHLSSSYAFWLQHSVYNCFDPRICTCRVKWNDWQKYLLAT